jgi:hypothetical protein
MDEKLSDLISALAAGGDGDPAKATSVRLPESLHRAVLLATDLGMDDSFTAATTAALRDRLLAFVRQQALAAHFDRFPNDVPSLAAVARRRVQGSGHPAAARPELIDEAANWIEQRRPDWALTGAVDEAVDEVLGYAEMIAAGVGNGRRRSA